MMLSYTSYSFEEVILISVCKEFIWRSYLINCPVFSVAALLLYFLASTYYFPPPLILIYADLPTYIKDREIFYKSIAYFSVKDIFSLDNTFILFNISVQGRNGSCRSDNHNLKLYYTIKFFSFLSAGILVIFIGHLNTHCCVQCDLFQ